MKILIIEDEKLPREGLFKLLSNKYKGIQILPPQINGREGLKCILLEKPEIILTDISMPDINGLEMISQLTTIDYKPYIIILSGFSKFEFAQKALTLGVKKYILKPYKVIDIIENIDIAIKEVSISAMHLSEIKLKENKIENNRHCSKLLIRYKKNYEISSIIKKIVLYLGKYFGSSSIINHSVDKNKQIILFSIYYNKNHQEKYYPTKDEINHRLTLSLNNQIVGFLIKNDELENFEYLLDDLLFAHCFFNLPNIAYISDIKINTKTQNLLFSTKEKMLSKSILDKDREACILNLDQWINEKIQLQSYPSEIYKDLKKWLYKIHSQLISNSSDVNIDEILTNIFDCFNIDQLKDNLHNVFIFQKDSNTDISNNTDNELIKQTLKLIESNIFKPIYLEEFAQQLSISSEHLSRQFKEELHIGFNQYVNNMKIEYAKGYFKKGDLKVSEISEKLGFSSSRYFSKVFKKVTGMNCKEYKKQFTY